MRLTADLVWEADKNHIVTYLSDNATKVLGLHVSECLGKTVDEIWRLQPAAAPDKDWADWRRPFRDVQAHYTTPQGEERIFALSGLPVFDLETDEFQCVRGIAKDVTAQNSQQLEIARHREHLQRLFDEQTERLDIAMSASKAGYWVRDLPLTKVFWSDENFRLLGYEPSEVEASYEAWMDRIHPDDREATAQTFNNSIEAQSDINLEYRVVHPDGAVLWINNVGKALVGPDGRTSTVTGIQIDNTERKQAEKSLAESESRFRRLFDNAEISIWDEDFSEVFVELEKLRAEGVEDLAAHLQDKPEEAYRLAGLVKINSVNEATLALYGVASERDFLDNLADMMSEDTIFVFVGVLCAIWNQDDYFVTEVSHRTFDDRFITVILSLPIPKTRTEYTHVPVCILDITERKQADLALGESEERFRDFADSASDWLWEMDENLRFTFISDLAQKLSGVPLDKMIGQTREELITKTKDREKWQGHLEDLEAHRPFRDFRYTFERADGSERNWSISGKPIFAAEGSFQGYRGTGTDITDLQAMERRLAQGQRMEAVGQLTGGIAHDFNNLLAVMIGNADILEIKAGDNRAVKQSIGAIMRAVERGSSLTNRLLAFSRQQTLSPVAADVTELIGVLEDMLRRTLGETIDLKFDAGPDLWPATIDPHQFENALINLAINARDAMPGGGMLAIETVNVTLDETYARQQEEVTPGDYVKVAVSDSGAGIPPEVVAKVFEPFFTTKAVGEGSGLGLSMVYGFAKQSKGHVTIYSEVSIGTTIKLYLPRSREALVREDAGAEAIKFARGSERILVVEDDPSVRKVPVSLLGNQGYQVVEAANGDEAIECLKNDQAFDLLFTDLALPGGMNGVEIAEAAVRIQPDIKVLYTTGYAEHAIVHRGQWDPEVTLVNKPYRRAELLEKVRAMLDAE